jgi:hypothetical protein
MLVNEDSLVKDCHFIRSYGSKGIRISQLGLTALVTLILALVIYLYDQNLGKAGISHIFTTLILASLIQILKCKLAHSLLTVDSKRFNLANDW